MNPDWQSWTAAGLVVVAASYLACRGWLAVRGKSAGGCGSCRTCPTSDSDQRPTAKPIVTVEKLLESSRRE